MASMLHAAIGAAAAMLFWTSLGLAVTRRAVPAVALPMAPVVGWAVHSAVALPIFFLLPFTAANVLAVACVVFLAAVAASLATARTDAIVVPVPPWAYVAAALLAMAPAAAVLPKVAGDAIYLTAPIFDHAKVALIDDLMKFGAPPGNPFFADAYPRLAYYYLWHFSAAGLALVTGISGWEADIALTWFSGFASLAVMMGVAARLGGRVAAILVVILSMTASARWALGWFFGFDNIEAVVGSAAGFAGWLFQSAWVPQHIISAACAVAAVVLMSQLAQRRNLLLVVTLALVVAAGFESSTWIGGVTFAMAGPIAAMALLGRSGPRRRWPFVAALALAAALAAGLVAPLLRDQLAATIGRGAPISLQFYPVLEAYFSDSMRAVLDPAAFWLVLLPIELSAVYLIGIAALLRLSWSRKLERDRRHIVWALAALALAGLGVSWLLASTLAENNDLGWRAILPATMALTVIAAAGLSRWIATRARVAMAASAIAIVLGLPGGIDLIRSYVTGRSGTAGRQFAASPELWAAVRRHAGVNDRIGNNPLLSGEMTPWPVNISWALLADRRSCFAGRELVLVYTTLGPQRTDEISAQFNRTFAGEGAPADIEKLATRYDCRVVVVTAADGAWVRDPFAASPYYRLVDEKAERWRIYRSTARD
jgi:hypothetical protein